MKKICFFTYNMFDLGGIQRVVSVLASELSRNYEVYIQCYDEPSKENRSLYALSENIKVIYSPKDNKRTILRKALQKMNQRYGMLAKLNSSWLLEYAYLLPTQQKLYEDIIKENEIDIAIAVGGFESYILGSIADRVNCKTIGWQHNSYQAYYETPGTHCWGMDYIIDKYFPMLDEYIVLNEHDEMEFLTKRNFKCKTIHNPKSFVSEKTSDLTAKRFIAAGRFIPVKNFDVLIDAFKKFSELNDDWTLSIYGDGDGREALEKQIEKEGLQNRVFLPGFSDHMADELLHSSCYLLPSKWEGMPMVILEALEVGLPIVSFDISAMIPLVDNDVEGIIVPKFDVDAFAQAMQTVSESAKLRERFGLAARRKAENFTVEKIVNKWENLLANL